MKKLLLLLLVVAGIVGCDKADGDKEKSYPDNYFSLEKFAKEYGIDTKIILMLGVNDTEMLDNTYFTGIKNNKLWIGAYNLNSKKQIKTFLSIDNYYREIKHTVPHVGEVIDTIKVNYIQSLITNDNSTVFLSQISTNKNSFFSEILFCKENEINKIIKIDFVNKIQEWSNNSILVQTDDFLHCLSLSGEFHYKVKQLPFIYNMIPINDIHECISYSGLEFKRMNLETSKELWNQTINLNIPETAKYGLTKSELFDTNTVKVTYNITLYDGTKTTKTVNIDVNTGEYTVL